MSSFLLGGGGLAFAWAVGLVVVAGFVTRLLSPILLRWVAGSLVLPCCGCGWVRWFGSLVSFGLVLYDSGCLDLYTLGLT